MKTKVDVILLCGGKAERLTPITEGVLAKSLVKVANKELIRYTLDLLDDTRINKLIFATNHYDDQIIEWAKKQNLLYEYDFSYQKKQGILDAIYCAAQQSNADTLIILNTDEIRLNFCFKDFLNYHLENKSSATIASTKTKNLYKHRVLKIDKNNFVKSSSLKNAQYVEHAFKTGFVNIGCLAINKSDLTCNEKIDDYGWSGLIDWLIQDKMLRACVDQKINYFNVGTLEEFIEADRFVSAITKPARTNQLIETASLDHV